MLEYIIWIILGTVYGIIIGVIPMAGATIGLMTVYSFSDIFMSTPWLGVIFMTSMLGSVSTADSFTAILTGIPGSNASTASIIDGYPMAKNGQAGRAIGISILDSTVNGIFWGALAFGLMPFYSQLILYFHTPEFAAFILLSLACVGFITVRNPILSVASIILGLFLGYIGQNPATGETRYTFCWEYLGSGIQLIPMIAGLFAVPELVNGFFKKQQKPVPITDYWYQLFSGFKDVWRYKREVIRGGFIGFFTGLLPGVGGTVGDFIAYGATVASNPNEKFGGGNPKGLLGVEGANNAQKPASLIPAFLFGIPAAPFAAIMMAICLTFGIEIGSPAVLADTSLIYSVGISFVLSTIICFFICIFAAKIIVKILEVPFYIYATVIGLVVLWSSMQYTGGINDFYILILCSILGLISYKIGLSRPAILIAFILAQKLENYTQQTLLMYNAGDLIQRPLFMSIIAIAIIVITWSMLRHNRGIEYR